MTALKLKNNCFAIAEQIRDFLSSANYVTITVHGTALNKQGFTPNELYALIKT